MIAAVAVAVAVVLIVAVVPTEVLCVRVSVCVYSTVVVGAHNKRDYEKVKMNV
jgi:hypothetical protein